MDCAEEYLSGLPLRRRERIEEVCRRFLSAVDGVKESMRYRMPTFERDGKWASIGNQKHHIAVYFCSVDLIRPVKEKYPRLSTGKGCIRIRDNQDVPLETLVKCFKLAMEMEK